MDTVRHISNRGWDCAVSYLRQAAEAVRSKISREEGQTLIEYGLLVAMIALGAVVALAFLSKNLQHLFIKTGNQLNEIPQVPVTPPDVTTPITP